MNKKAGYFGKIIYRNFKIGIQFLCAFVLIVGGFNFNPIRVFAAGSASVTAVAPLSTKIGESFKLPLTFSNSGNATAYGPYIDVISPNTGADGNDGINITGGTYLGNAVTMTSLIFSGVVSSFCPGSEVFVLHPYALDNTGLPLKICGKIGDTLNVFQLPYGSFTVGQPSATVILDGNISNLADSGTPLNIKYRGGFAFGSTPTNDFAADPSIFSPQQNISINPGVFTVKKTYQGPESETSTGPNFPRNYTICADIASGQSITNLDLIDNFPADLAFLNVVSTSPSGASVITSPTVGLSSLAPNNKLTVRFPSVTGGIGDTDACVVLRFFVDKNKGGNPANPVISPASGAAVQSTNDSNGTGFWQPIDNRDTAGTVSDNGPASDHILNDKSIAIQKNVQNITSGSTTVRPGDVLEYTMNIQLSDYFTANNLIIDDTFSDGQTMSSSFAPTFNFTDKNGTIGGNIPAGAITWDYSKIGNDPTNVNSVTDGSTSLQFNLSNAMIALGGNGRITGGLASGTPGIGAVGTVRFRTIVSQNFTDDYNSITNNSAVSLNDVISNVVNKVTANILNNQTLVPTGNVVNDTTNTSISTGNGNLTKVIYAVNGSTSFVSNEISAGDEVTFRLQYSVPQSDTQNFSINDFLPLPTFNQIGVSTVFNNTISSSIPAQNSAKFGPSHTFAPNNLGFAPIITKNAVENSIKFDFGNNDDPLNRASNVDILLNVTASNIPIGDGLFVNNQARANLGTSNGISQVADSTSPVVITEPKLKIRKGIIGAPDVYAAYIPINYQPGTIVYNPNSNQCPRISGFDSNALAAGKGNSDLVSADGNDDIMYMITVENLGRGSKGAFDVKIKDVLPPELINPRNLCVTRGDGTAPIPFSNIGGGLFDPNGGIELTDPGNMIGALEKYNPANGKNIAVITYYATIIPLITPKKTILNTATLLNYSASDNGINISPQTQVDTAQINATKSPTISKSIISTNQPSTLNGDMAIGEIVKYRLTVNFPEGRIPNAFIEDNLDPGLIYMGCSNVQISNSALVTSTVNLNNLCTGSSPAISNGAKKILFNLGDLTNGNTLNSFLDTISIDYDVVVDNVGGNTNGKNLLNNAAFKWGSSPVESVSTTASVKVALPKLKILKTVNPSNNLDAGDNVNYTITISHDLPSSLATAFDVQISDILPAGIIYNPGSLQLVSGIAPNILTELGGLINVNFSSLSLNQTSVISFSGTVPNNAVPSQVITNTANLKYSTLPGLVNTPQTVNSINSIERESATNSNASFTVKQPAPVKSIVSTSENFTGNVGGLENVAIGETVRYRLVATLAEGTIPDLKMVDSLPAGLTFLNNGNVKYGFSSDNSGSLVANLSGLPTGCVQIGSSNSINPGCNLPGSAITATGNTVTFGFGQLTNSESDINNEYIALEFDAIVNNNAASNAFNNQTGAVIGKTWDNNYHLDSGNTVLGTSPIVKVNITEPVINNLTKTVTTAPSDAGDNVVYKLTFSNTATGNNASPAFDINVFDQLDSYLILDNPTSTSITWNIPVGSTISNISTPTSASVILNRLNPGESAIITVTARVINTAPNGYQIPNTAKLIYSGMPGTVAVERTGLDGVNSLNDYVSSSSVNTLLNSPQIDKLSPTKTNYKIGEVAEFDYKITLPEGTTNLFSVFDNLPVNLIYDGYEVIKLATGSGGLMSQDYDGTVTSTPTVTTTGSIIKFDFGSPNTSGNLGTDKNIFVLRVKTRVRNIPGNINGFTVSNLGYGNFASPQSGNTLLPDPTPANISLVEPNLIISKDIINPPSIMDAGATVSFNLNIKHNTQTPNQSSANAYNLKINDTLDPRFISPSCISVTSVPALSPNIDCSSLIISGQNISLTPGIDLPLGAVIDIKFSTVLSNTVKPNSIIPNIVVLNYQSLPIDPNNGEIRTNYTKNASAQITTGTNNSITKSLISTSNPDTSGNNLTIGEKSTFEFTVQTGEGTHENFTITDNLPAGMEYVPGSLLYSLAPGFAGTVNAPVISGGTGGLALSINFGTVVLGGDNNLLNNFINIQFSVIIKNLPINSTPPPSNLKFIQNSSTLSETGATNVNSNLVDINIIGPKIVFQKSFQSGQSVPGEFTTVTLTAQNTGLAPAYNVEFIDILNTEEFYQATEILTPNSFTYSRILNTNSEIVKFTANQGILINPGETVSASFKVKINKNKQNGTILNNTANVNYFSLPNGNLDGEKRAYTENSIGNITVITPNLDIKKDNNLAIAVPGQILTYKIDAANLTPLTISTNVVITETVPANTKFQLSGSTPGWSCPNGSIAGTVCTFLIPILNYNQPISFDFALKVDDNIPESSVQIINNVQISDDGTHGIDPNLLNNNANDSDELSAVPNLLITKDDGKTSTGSGDVLIYNIKYGNIGNQEATGVVITETVPENSTFEPSFSDNGWICDNGGNAGANCRYVAGISGNLPSGAINNQSGAVGSFGQVKFAVRLNSTFPAGTENITNIATIEDNGQNGTDPDILNNTAKDIDILNAVPNLVISKTDGKNSLTLGDNTTYTITVQNTGSQGAVGIIVKDILPANTTLISPNNLQIDSNNTITFPSFNLGAGGVKTFTVEIKTLLILPTGPTTITNTVNVADDGLNGVDPDLSNNTSIDIDNTNGAIDLKVQKTADKTLLVPEDLVIYKIEYSNIGNHGAIGSVITEIVPANTVFYSINSTAGWSCPDLSPAGTICNFNPGDLVGKGPLQSVNFALKVNDTTASQVNDIKNNVKISAPLIGNSPDSDLLNNSFDLNLPLVAGPDIEITKTDGAGISVAGDGHVYKLTVKNSGNQTGTGVVVSENVPGNSTFDLINSTTGWSCPDGSIAGTFCNYLIGNLNAGEVKIVNFATKTNPNFPSGAEKIINIAFASDDGSNGEDKTPGNNQEGDTNDINAVPDLKIVKTQINPTAPTKPGDTISYNLNYSNIGTQDANGVLITEIVPANTVFYSIGSTSGWNCPNGSVSGTVCNFNIANLPAGNGNTTGSNSGNILFNVRVIGPLPSGVKKTENTATINDDGINGIDPSPENNSSTLETGIIAAPNLAIIKNNLNGNVAAGEIVNYNLAVKNIGDQSATGVVITETIPQNATFDSASSTQGWDCPSGSAGGTICTLLIGNLGVGTILNSTFSVKINSSIPAGTLELSNIAKISDDGQNGADPEPENNESTKPNPISAVPDLYISKTDGKTVAAGGNNLIYKIDYGNSGTKGAKNIVIIENIPNGTNFDSNNSTPGWDCTSAGNGKCKFTIPGIVGGGNGTVNFAINVNSPVSNNLSSIVNTVTISDDGLNGTDPNLLDNSATDTDLIADLVDLKIEKTVINPQSNLVINPGGAIKYNLKYSNIGPKNASAVVISETVPQNTTFNAGASTVGWSCLNGSVAGTVCNFIIGNLDSNQGGNVLFSTNVDSNLPAGQPISISNTAKISRSNSVSGVDGDLGNNSSNVAVLVGGGNQNSGTGSISGHIFSDTNNNGIQDTGENNLPNISVKITDSSNVSTIATTNSNGDWFGYNLPAGSFTALVNLNDVDIPAGSVVSTNSSGGGASQSGSVVIAQVTTSKPVGFFNPLLPATISGHIFSDTNNNGIQEAGENNLPNVSVKITDGLNNVITVITDSNGDYNLNVLPGEIKTEIDILDGDIPIGAGISTSAFGGTSNQIINVIPGSTTALKPVGFHQGTTISGHIFNDLNNNGIQDTGENNYPNITIQIQPSIPGSGPIFVETDSIGNYTAKVPAGAATISVNQNDPDYPNGAVVTTNSVGGGLVQIDVALPGENTQTKDIGLVILKTTISGHIFSDTNNNGIQEAGENNLPNVSVKITDSQNQIQTVQTDSGGNYKAALSAPGTVISQIIPTTILIPNYTVATVGVIGTLNSTITAVLNTDTPAHLVGIYSPLYPVTGHLFNDSNNNGIQDGGESNYPNISVKITDANGVISFVQTDNVGNYTANLPAGNSKFEINLNDPDLLPGSFVTTNQLLLGTATTTVNVLVNSGSPQIPQQVQNVGFYRDQLFPVPTTVSGNIFYDTNSNGIFNAGGENYLPGIPVQITDGGGNIQTVFTDGNGNYQAVITVPGQVSVNIDQNSSLIPGGSSITTTSLGGNDTQILNTVLGKNTPAVPVGFVQKTTISGHIFSDLNNNGIQDLGEINLPNISVKITDSLGIIQTVQTDLIGNYSIFVSPGIASVIVNETDPDLALGSVISTNLLGGTGNQTITAISGQNVNSIDVGFYVGKQIKTTISGHIFSDLNNNGIQDTGEMNLPGIVVEIKDNVNPVFTVYTDLSGNYSANVPAGIATATANIPAFSGFIQSTTLKPLGTIVSSVEAILNTNTPIQNLGLYKPMSILTGKIYGDTNNNGNLNVGENGLGGVTVNIYSGNILVTTVLTDYLGVYTVPNLPLGTFTAIVNLNGGGIVPGSIVTTGNNNQIITNLIPGSNLSATNVGIFKPKNTVATTVSGFVFADLNGNAIAEAGELGLVNISVKITDSTGLVQTVFTDENGFYRAIVAPGPVSIVVDENDPNLPILVKISTISTGGKGAQTITAISGQDTKYIDVGFFQFDPDIKISKSANKDNVKPGDIVLYIIEHENSGYGDAIGGKIIEQLPKYTKFTPGNGSSENWTCVDNADGSQTCERLLGVIPGETKGFSYIAVTILEIPADQSTLLNNVSISALNFEKNTANNSAKNEIQVFKKEKANTVFGINLGGNLGEGLIQLVRTGGENIIKPANQIILQIITGLLVLIGIILSLRRLLKK